VLLRLGAACLTLTVILGALIGAGYLAPACTSFPDCDGRWWPEAAGWPALQTLAVLQAAPAARRSGGCQPAPAASLRSPWRRCCFLARRDCRRCPVPSIGGGPRRCCCLCSLRRLALGILTVLAGFSLVAGGCLTAACAAVLLATLASLLHRGVTKNGRLRRSGDQPYRDVVVSVSGWRQKRRRPGAARCGEVRLSRSARRRLP
jgi:hypothetical protein